MSGTNSWLQRQRKSDLVDIAENVGLKNYESLKKSDLEVQLDDYLAGHQAQFASDSKLAGYYSSRARTIGSPVKKDAPELKVSKRRTTKSTDDNEDEEEGSRSTTTALARTPSRALALASRIPLPATPADVASAVDRGTLAVRKRVASIYADSGVTEATAVTRETLSTVTSIQFCIAAFEYFFLRREILADRYAFTVPAIAFLGTGDYAVHIPDMFLLLTASFWSPFLLWTFTSLVVPSFFGYFFNLTSAHHGSGRGRPRASGPDYSVDPLTFSIVKAVLTYLVYAQGINFAGFVDDNSVARIKLALFGGWQGVLVGTGVTALASLWDAILKK